MAPRPVRQKYWPDSSELRHGVQRGRGDERVPESNAPARQAVDHGCFDNLVDGRAIVQGGVNAGVTPPIISEAEEMFSRLSGHRLRPSHP